MIPAVAFFGVFFIYPVINALYLSFFDAHALRLDPPEFVGFGNYIRLFNSSRFWNSMYATGVFAGGTFLMMVVPSLALAVLLMSRKRFQKWLQLAYFSPAVVSTAVAAAIWLLMLDPRGIANQLVNAMTGASGVDRGWLTSGGMIQLSTMLIYSWRYVGYFTIIFVAGLATIPTTLYESAVVDGASAWQKFRRITFPLLKPTTLLVSVLAVIQTLRTFSTQYMLTRAGVPRGPIDVLPLNIFHTAISESRIGRASALSMILLVIIFTLTWLQFRIARSEEVTYE